MREALDRLVGPELAQQALHYITDKHFLSPTAVHTLAHSSSYVNTRTGYEWNVEARRPPPTSSKLTSPVKVASTIDATNDDATNRACPQFKCQKHLSWEE
jgi:hypothetical protein